MGSVNSRGGELTEFSGPISRGGGVVDGFRKFEGGG